mmetsp:Transcript_4175/g.12168  ORF Transcript_4175/g.12168 Transcript_4175/m.12168 type:complete len:216 (-) Transcript_4175:239-886(-)
MWVLRTSSPLAGWLVKLPFHSFLNFCTSLDVYRTAVGLRTCTWTCCWSGGGAASLACCCCIIEFIIIIIPPGSTEGKHPRPNMPAGGGRNMAICWRGLISSWSWFARMPTGMIPIGRLPAELLLLRWCWLSDLGDTLGWTDWSFLSRASKVARELLDPLFGSGSAAGQVLCCWCTVSSVVSKSDVRLFLLFPVLVCLMKYFCAWDATCVGVRVCT